jgi:hypothetical protein
MTEKNIEEAEKQILDRFNTTLMRNTETSNEDYYTDLIDELEELIACDVFSAFLNDKGEIFESDSEFDMFFTEWINDNVK